MCEDSSLKETAVQYNSTCLNCKKPRTPQQLRSAYKFATENIAYNVPKIADVDALDTEKDKGREKKTKLFSYVSKSLLIRCAVSYILKLYKIQLTK